MSRSTRVSVEQSLAAFGVAARPGVCPECTHESTERRFRLRSWWQRTPRPAACSRIVDEESWALAGGVGELTRCGCRNAFHGS